MACGTRVRLSVDFHGNLAEHWDTRSVNEKLQLQPELREFLSTNYPGGIVMMQTEFKSQHFKLRCHPNFRGQGPFYDWFLAKNENNENVPCLLRAVIPGNHNKFEGIDLICEMSISETGEKSSLFTDWNHTTDLKVVKSECVLQPLFVVDIHHDTVSVAKETCLWASEFTDCDYD